VIRAAAPIAVSILVLLMFGTALGLAMTKSLPAGSEPLLNVLLGTLTAMASQVVNFWMGSSAGSRDKDAVIAAAKTLAPDPKAPPVL